jgi:hypothetical protein
MPDTLLDLARQEAEELEARIAAMPLGRRLAAVRELIRVYSEPARARATLDESSTNLLIDAIARRTKTAEIIDAGVDFLRRRSSRATSTEIAEELVARGLTWGGDNSPQHLSSYLSTSDRFDNDRTKGGYGLIEWTKQNARREAAE